MSQLPDNGATQLPVYAQESKEVCVHEPCNPVSKKGPHYWRWVWVNGVWLNKLRCSTCGAEKEPSRE